MFDFQEKIERERNLLLYRKHQEWINLNESYALQQRECLDATFNTVEEYERSISEMVSEHYGKYRATKKKLDMEVQVKNSFLRCKKKKKKGLRKKFHSKKL